MRYKSIIIVLIVLSFALMLPGCYGASNLKTSYSGNLADIKGSFDVVYYGNRYLDDPANVVVLDVSGDDYKIMPQAIKGSYRIETGLAADEAVRKGIAFLKRNKYYDGVTYRAIYALDGSVIGYEMMPEYEQLTYPSRRMISVNYSMGGGNEVRFYVHELSLLKHGIRSRE